jgi:hypothetical protein
MIDESRMDNYRKFTRDVNDPRTQLLLKVYKSSKKKVEFKNSVEKKRFG